MKKTTLLFFAVIAFATATLTTSCEDDTNDVTIESLDLPAPTTGGGDGNNEGDPDLGD